MDFHLFRADKERQKWSIRGDLWNGFTAKFSGHRDKKVAEQIMRNIASLNRSKHLGELPDPHLLPWINSLPEKQAKRYVDLGLLPSRMLDKRRPVNELVEAFATSLKNNSEDGSRWAKQWPELVRRLFATIGPDASFASLDDEKVNVALKKMNALSGRWKGQPISQRTKREYIFAMKAFCGWMVKKRGAMLNPIENMEAPTAKADPIRNRRPLSHSDFSQLKDYLRGAPPKYPHQLFPWTPEDRLMVYWTAVKTGFRANELRSLTRASVDFDSESVGITVKGSVAKNRTRATVPITDADFIRALKEYSLHQLPDAPLLQIPSSSRLTEGLYRDLDAAKVRREFDNGTVVDFHTLRSTAIVWWLKEGFDLLEVQHRARLLTLTLVQDYVKNYVPDYQERMRKRREGSGDNPPVLRVS